MSLKPNQRVDIPAETARIAPAIFPQGNDVMRLRDELGQLYTEEQFADLFPSNGHPAESPATLAWVLVLQFMEGLTDRQTADAVRSRIDWKYALGLELTDPGFDFSILCEFRARLIAGHAETRLLDTLLTAFQARGLLTHRPAPPSAGTRAGAGPTTPRLNPCADGGPRPQSTRTRGRNLAPCLKRMREVRTDLAEDRDAGGVVSALCQTL